MTSEDRLQKIEEYGKAHAMLVEALKEFPEEIRQWRDEHGCWSVHEHFVHVTDSEVNSYVRCRRLIAEQGESLMAYDENLWASSLDYHGQSIQGALELFKLLREQSYALIKTLPEDVWSHTGIHTVDGEMSLDDWLDTYSRHVPEHIGYMRENLEAWKARGKG